tara:strand:- start:1451 stop:1942 length:492 start_codon:yes stop_codon:yes gene_type:complete
MGFLGETFDINDIPEAEKREFEPVPAGWYTATIANAELRDTKAGTGKYISVRFDITGPEHQGRVVFTNLNTSNPNPKAEEIGRQQLGEVMRSVGLQKLEDTDQLLGGNLSIKVTVRNDPNYGPGNEVRGFKAIEGSLPPVSAPAAPPAKAAETATAAKAPWAK